MAVLQHFAHTLLFCLFAVLLFAMPSGVSSKERPKDEELSCSEHGMGKKTQKDKKGHNDKKDEKYKKDKKHEKDTPGKPIKKENKDKLAAKHGAAVARKASAVAKPNKTTSAKDES